jgi:hypothetical protein
MIVGGDTDGGLVAAGARTKCAGGDVCGCGGGDIIGELAVSLAAVVLKFPRYLFAKLDTAGS